MSVVLYWLGVRSYSLLVRIAAMFRHKAKLFVKGRKDIQQHIHYSLIDERRPRIWMHCASLGEFEQGRPVLEQLKQQYTNYAIVLTFFSPSGYEIRKNYQGADYVFYLPEDSPYNAREFVASVKPALTIFVKYDLWYFYLQRLAKKDMPLLLVSAIFRKGQVFFSWYGKLHRSMLNMCTQIFVQDSASQQLLNRIGIEHVSVAGDTRFDRVTRAVENVEAVVHLPEFCNGSKIIVAGSTWPQDEQLLKQVIEQLPAEWKIVIVPHETDATHISALLQQYEGEAITWSRFGQDYYDQRIMIVDTVGLLLRLYQYADVTYVGGGFNKSGIHNILEAAVYGLPVFHGPIYHKFKEAQDLREQGAAIPVTDATTMLQRVIDWETNRIEYNGICAAARKYVLSQVGATQTIADYIAGKELLKRL